MTSDTKTPEQEAEEWALSLESFSCGGTEELIEFDEKKRAYLAGHSSGYSKGKAEGRKEALEWVTELIHKAQNGLPRDEFSEGKMSALECLDMDIIQELSK